MPVTPAAASVSEAAIDAENLRVDPAPVRAREEGNDVRHVLGLAETLQWGKVAQPRDVFFRLAVEEKLRGCGSGGNRIHRDATPGKLVGEHVHEAFHTLLRRNVWAVGWEGLENDAARECDDPAAIGDVLSRLRKNEESAAKIRSNHLIEDFDIALCDRRQ